MWERPYGIAGSLAIGRGVLGQEKNPPSGRVEAKCYEWESQNVASMSLPAARSKAGSHSSVQSGTKKKAHSPKLWYPFVPGLELTPGLRPASPISSTRVVGPRKLMAFVGFNT